MLGALSTRLGRAAVACVALSVLTVACQGAAPSAIAPSPTPSRSQLPAQTASPTNAATPTAPPNVVLPLGGHTATLLPNGKVLIAGGFTDASLPTAVAYAELYDAVSGTWSATGAMTRARAGHTATLLASGKVLVTGDGGTSAELYDPATGTWAATGDAVTERVQGNSATLLRDGRVLVPDELYDPDLATWTATGPMVGQRGCCSTATLLRDGRVLVTGGGAPEGCAVRDAELFDPDRGTWAATGFMTVDRIFHAAALLADGRVLVAGGVCGDVDYVHSSAELYDPERGSWTATGSMSEARSSFTATLLRNGQVLVLGGFHEVNLEDVAIASAELYDPATGRWSSAPNLTVARAGHSATLLRNGKVLVVGVTLIGYESNSVGSAELYDPGIAP